MKQEDKELLLKDLCARFVYHPFIYGKSGYATNDGTLTGVFTSGVHIMTGGGSVHHYFIEEVKPYLRPMQSMTNEEREEYRKLCKKVVRKMYVSDGTSVLLNKKLYRYFGTKTEYYDTYQSIDYLISRHFDYRGLIGKKLALKATKGMYEI